MQTLYPIIRRVRRPLLPPEEKAALVVAEPRVETVAAIANAAGEGLTAVPPLPETRTEARQKKGKAD